MKKSNDLRNSCGGSHHSVFRFWDLKMKVLYGLFLEKSTYVIMGVLRI
jgi:hypothetical protein